MKTATTAAAAALIAALTSTAVSAFSAPAASSTTSFPGEVDTTAAFASFTFPISPPDLISRAKQVLFSPEIGIGTKDSGACLAPDFEFVAAVVGPIGREEYLNALGGFKLEESFDIEQNTFGFTVDPLQPNRVWWYGRQISTQIAPFMGVEPSSSSDNDDSVVATELTLPPQSFHMDFTEEGLVKEFGF